MPGNRVMTGIHIAVNSEDAGQPCDPQGTRTDSRPASQRASQPVRAFSVAALLLALISSTGCASTGQGRPFKLGDVQGFWWERCDDPAVQFAIEGERYFGVEWDHPVRVEDGVLIVDRSPEPPLTFRIVAATPRRLVLRSADPIDAPAPDWVLRTCPQQKPLAGGADAAEPLKLRLRPDPGNRAQHVAQALDVHRGHGALRVVAQLLQLREVVP